MESPENIQPENGRISSGPDSDFSDGALIDFVCKDPADDKKPCPICDGKGFVKFDVPMSDPRYGKFQRCPNNPVRRDHELHKRLRRFGRLSAYQDKTFDSFRTDMVGGSYTQHVCNSLVESKRAAQTYAQEPQGWLVFEGQIGCGKTHLAVAIANTRLEIFGQQVVFVTAPDLLDFLRMSFSSSGESTYDAYFEQIRNVSLLVLDDLGVENPSPWAKEKLFQLLNYRHVNQLSTIITTSTSFDDLDPWLSSRIMDRDIVKHIRINAPDFRRTRHSQTLDERFSNLQLYREMRFDTFSVESAFRGESASLRRVLQAAENWSAEPKNWLCILGDFGSGKTHLAASIANDLHERGKDVMFTTVTDLLDYLRVAFDPQSRSRFDKRFHSIVNIPVLILDDLSTASATPWAKEKLFQIIENRYIAKSPTVITASDTIEKLERTAPRIVTRVLDRRICEVYALDEVRSYIYRISN